ncbi:hypothetical protein C8R43DRAFT_1113919 [Mycena crocata]|nr:hypothetical protein C8R43DRAFT_1113919 [Mycena crocata]
MSEFNATQLQLAVAQLRPLRFRSSSFKVYKPFTSTAPPPPLPDEYFTPTASDLKLAQSGLAARTQALTTIRIRFTDRTQLEKVFPSTSKIRAVYAFVQGVLREDVQGVLREDVQPVKFVLCIPTPKRDLKVCDPSVRDLTLSELSLAPSSVLLLRFEDPAHEEMARGLNGSTTPAPPRPRRPRTGGRPPRAACFRLDIDNININIDMRHMWGGGKVSGAIEKKIPKWLKMGLNAETSASARPPTCAQNPPLAEPLADE